MIGEITAIYPSTDVDHILNWLLKDPDWSHHNRNEIDKEIFSNQNGYSIYGYRVEGKVEAIVEINTHIGYLKQAADDAIMVDMLYVNQSYQRHGIGTELMNFIIERYGEHQLWVNPYLDNLEAQRFYTKFGFEYCHQYRVMNVYFHLMRRESSKSTKEDLSQ